MNRQSLAIERSERRQRQLDELCRWETKERRNAYKGTMEWIRSHAYQSEEFLLAREPISRHQRNRFSPVKYRYWSRTIHPCGFGSQWPDGLHVRFDPWWSV